FHNSFCFPFYFILSEGVLSYLVKELTFIFPGARYKHRGAPVAHGGNPQDRAGLPVTCHLSPAINVHGLKPF
ncbi:hypothetical protein, partial [Richelia sinica]|uniref:hypothetical protein n=1 Tax=Richelia sinica TaxID=1357545 RepID=UPI001A7E8E3E